MCELMFVLTEVEGNTQYLKKLAISFGMPLTSDVLGVELFSLISSHDTAINLLKSVQIVLYTSFPFSFSLVIILVETGTSVLEDRENTKK